MGLYNEYLFCLVCALSINLFYKWKGSRTVEEGDSTSKEGENNNNKDGEKSAENNNNESGKSDAPVFTQFQKQFLFVYLIMMAADWMQGPYVYELYRFYGFTHAENGILFIAGFGSSLVFGTWAGPLADRYGRKFCCILYGIAYIVSCMTKHFPNFGILMIGRLTGGFATSILWSAFESWMVSEHINRKFPKKDMDSTFSLMFTFNGLVAISAGFIAQWSVSYFGHPVAPFDVSIVFLIVGTIFVYYSWPENYGNEHKSLTEQFQEAWDVVKRDTNVRTVGIIASSIESSMFCFVFGWTNALDGGGTRKIPHGLIFAAFMTSTSLGGSVFSFLMKKSNSKKVMQQVAGAAMALMMVPVFTNDENILMLSFIFYEIVIGVFWPCIGSLRAEYIPEDCRATVSNFFRVPLNVNVCIILLFQGYLTTSQTFLACATLNGVAFAYATFFVNAHAAAPAATAGTSAVVEEAADV